MAKQFHRVEVQVFLADKEQPFFLNELIPYEYEDFIQTQFVYDKEHNTRIYSLNKSVLRVQESYGFEKKIVIFTFSFEKITHTNKMFKKILNNLSPKDKKLLHESLYERVDEHGRLSIRLEKNALMNKEYTLASKGEVVQIYFLLAAYPKNTHTIRQKIQELFEGMK